MSLPPEFAQRIGFIPGIKGSHEAPTLPLEESPELAPNGKGFLVTSRTFDEADPQRFLGTLPNGLSASALDLNRDNPSLMDYAIWKPEDKKLIVETFNFAKNPQSASDAELRGKKLADSGYNIASRTYPERVILLAAKKAEPDPSPRMTEVEEVELA